MIGILRELGERGRSALRVPPKALVVTAAVVVLALAFVAGSSAVRTVHHHLGPGVVPRLGRIIPQRLPPFIAYEWNNLQHDEQNVGGIFLIKPDGSDKHA